MPVLSSQHSLGMIAPNLSHFDSLQSLRWCCAFEFCLVLAGCLRKFSEAKHSLSMYHNGLNLAESLLSGERHPKLCKTSGHFWFLKKSKILPSILHAHMHVLYYYFFHIKISLWTFDIGTYLTTSIFRCINITDLQKKTTHIYLLMYYVNSKSSFF